MRTIKDILDLLLGRTEPEVFHYSSNLPPRGQG